MKLDSYILSDDTINLLKAVLERTKKEKKELGCDLCADINTKEIKTGKICVGTTCEVEFEGECKEGEILVGNYHTHPFKSIKSKPSLDDLAIGLKYGIMCMGSVSENNIKCYVKKSISPKKDSSIMIKVLELLRKRDERSLTEKDFKEFMMLENKLKKKNFRVFNI
jgi:hypothetical protein